MEVKKTPQADLEKRRIIFLQTGFVIVLAILLLAFEWTSSENQANSLGEMAATDMDDEMIPITRQEEVPPPPPPPKPQVTEILSIVDDDVEIEDEIEIEDMEADEDMMIEIDMEDEVEEATIFFIVEDMPIFMPNKCKTEEEGQLELRKYIHNNVNYPEIARENGIQGRVFVSFTVNPKGIVINVKIARGIDPSLDKEAVKVIKSLPKFSPGKQRGKSVPVGFTVPINFKLG